MASEMDERTVTISGVKVCFPCKPYPSQFCMMDRVIKGLERRQNSLLESPTGSGKSLALLCSALAWQNMQHEKLACEGVMGDQGAVCNPCECNCNKNPVTAAKTEYSPETKPKSTNTIVIPESDDEDEDDDFRSSMNYRTPKVANNKKRDHVKITYEDNIKQDLELPTKCTCNAEPSVLNKKPKVPTIYFGTRTHKQIAQITRELGKTAYHDARMVILASREYTCIHPEVSQMKNKSEGCRERLDINHGVGCKFNDRAKRTFLSQAQLQAELPTSWDIEDLVKACNQKKACPYFVTRNIKDKADIIFCPYNYLIDPLVRKSMDINLKDQVVILDEAHNIEDCARDAASGSLTTEEITQALHNVQEMLDVNVKFNDHLKMRRMLDSLLQFIEENSHKLDQADYDTSYKVWSGFDIVARLKSIGLGPESFEDYKASLENVSSSDEDQSVVRNRRNQEVKLKTGTLNTLELIVQLLDYMYRDDLRFVEDYRVAVMKSMQFVPHKNTNDSWMSKNRRGGSRVEIFTLNFWCMNPAVAFSDFTPCRNIVLSSGTLSPMSSFSSELGVDFPIQLEANHIIQDKQVMVGALGVGPGGSQLQAVYRNMETYTFQDELGNLILQVCQNVEHGVLCFLPSYRALEKFTERWKLTGLWARIASRKRVLVEPRRGRKEDFDDMMKAFYEVVKGDTTSDYLNEVDHCDDDSDIDGALFLAVCRGKVSEGMDFADNNARAVITVGIPFPSIKDLQVKLKREYNDKHRAARGLLSGNEWYEIQAFRALNQALGRCIRHRKDWGALIIVDDRFVKNSNKYCKGLSKWVRNKVQTYTTFSQFRDALTNFTDMMIKEMPVVSPNTSFIPCTPGTARKDSIYKRDQMDTSLVATPKPSPDMRSLLGASPVLSGTSLSQSPYFSPHSSPAGTLAKGQLQNFMPGAKIVMGNNSLPIVEMSSGVSSLSLEQQLKQIISSSMVPKDQAYYVLLNKGKSDEQTFLIEPNKKGLSKPKDTLPVPTQTTGPASSSIPAPLKPSCPLTSPPVQLQAQPQWKTYMAVGGPSLSPQDQLQEVMTSPLIPKHEPYFVVVNNGQSDQQTFLIQPPAPTPAPASSNTGTLPVNPAPVVDPQNKFLRFCQLPPKTPATNVPVATVTPQRQTSLLQKPAADINASQTNEASSTTAAITTASSITASSTTASSITGSSTTASSITASSTTAASTAAATTSVPVVDTEQKVIDTEVKIDPGNSVKSAVVRKPLFKKKVEKCDGSVEAPENTADGKIGDKCNFHDDVKQEKRESSASNGRSATKLKQKRRSEDNCSNNVDDILSSVKVESNVSMTEQSFMNVDNSEEDDFLVTRRRSGRKRKTSSRLAGSKRIKGVQYNDDDDEKADMKENLQVNKKKSLKCAGCGNTLIIQADCEYEYAKHHPTFLHKWCPKSKDLLHFSSLPLKTSGLVPLSIETALPGIQVNSFYDDKTCCSVQYLQCKACLSKGTSSKKNTSVVGAHVVLADRGSTVGSGEAWILSSAVTT